MGIGNSKRLDHLVDHLEMLRAVPSKNKHMQHTNYLLPSFEELPHGDSGCESESESDSVSVSVVDDNKSWNYEISSEDKTTDFQET